MPAEFIFEENEPRLLHRFAKWYMKQLLYEGQLPVCTVFDNCSAVGKHIGVTLFRKGSLQVQMWLGLPGAHVPDHVHPNVESYELYFGGPIYFSKNGKFTSCPASVFELPDGKSNAWGGFTKLGVDEPHGGYIGDKPAAFLSIQHWINGVKPSSVEKDWDGELYGAEHQVTSGK